MISSAARLLSRLSLSQVAKRSPVADFGFFFAKKNVSTFVFKRSLYSQPTAAASATQPAMAKLDGEALKKYIVPLETKVPFLDAVKAFEQLSPNEKLYVHYWSKASWAGGLITVLQTSPESPAIFVLLQNLFRHNQLAELETIAKDVAKCTDEEWQALKFYAGGFYHNMGNYVGFGDTKLIPGLPKDKLRQIVFSSNAYSKNSAFIEELWTSCADRMYDLDNVRLRQLGLKPEGTTTYFSTNCTKKDADIVKKFLEANEIEAYNSRVFKTVHDGRNRYEVRLASSRKVVGLKCGKLQVDEKLMEFNGHEFVITSGDYDFFMEEMSKALKAAVPFANPVEKNMLEKYVESFDTGSLDAHKDGSRFWIQNKKPIVEGYIGFIETYRDPSGQRGEFEGFVAVVDKEKSNRLNKLVDAAEEFISKLPWPREYEKDKFLRPDFSELSVVAFASSGVPIGINIPNYDEIRQNEGFKNVSLGNVISAALKSRPPQFLSQVDHDLLTKHEALVLEIQVALHELLGHGSGKLFEKKKDGSFNFDYEKTKDFESRDVCSYYEVGQSYDSVFGDLASAYEECRAETVAIYLALFPEILAIWGIQEKDIDDVIYCVWLAMAVSGIKSLPYCNVDEDETRWLQAHARGRFAILRVMQEAGLIKVDLKTGDDGKPDLVLSLDRTKIKKEGKEAVGNFLGRLQLYKSTAQKEQAFEMMTEYTHFMPPEAETLKKWHEIAIARRVPRNLLVQANTNLTGDKKDVVVMKSYPASIDGMILSFQERYENFEAYEEALLQLAERDAHHFTDLAME